MENGDDGDGSEYCDIGNRDGDDSGVGKMGNDDGVNNDNEYCETFGDKDEMRNGNCGSNIVTLIRMVMKMNREMVIVVI